MCSSISNIMQTNWHQDAINLIESDFQRSGDTHLIKVHIDCFDGIDLYLKDESTHPTGSLKHRLARSLFLYAICNGWVKQGTPIIESSSGSTAVSEAYFAQLLKLPFIAVMPKSTAKTKIKQIEFYGGQCHLVDSTAQIYSESEQLAKALNGHYMDQFTYAERATDWRGNNNIATSIFNQMSKERYPIPNWIVMSPGTGGTSATIGRYIRYQCHATKLCCPDPEHSVFYDFYHSGDVTITSNLGSKIEGIGRPRVEPSFMPKVIERMDKVSDAHSIATMQWLSNHLGRKVGPSTGTNFYCVLQLAKEMHARNQKGSIVSLLCDSGERYLETYYQESWLASNIGDLSLAQKDVQQLLSPKASSL